MCLPHGLCYPSFTPNQSFQTAMLEKLLELEGVYIQRVSSEKRIQHAAFDDTVQIDDHLNSTTTSRDELRCSSTSFALDTIRRRPERNTHTWDY